MDPSLLFLLLLLLVCDKKSFLKAIKEEIRLLNNFRPPRGSVIFDWINQFGCKDLHYFCEDFNLIARQLFRLEWPGQQRQ